MSQVENILKKTKLKSKNWNRLKLKFIYSQRLKTFLNLNKCHFIFYFTFYFPNLMREMTKPTFCFFLYKSLKIKVKERI